MSIAQDTYAHITAAWTDAKNDLGDCPTQMRMLMRISGLDGKPAIQVAIGSETYPLSRGNPFTVRCLVDMISFHSLHGHYDPKPDPEFVSIVTRACEPLFPGPLAGIIIGYGRGPLFNTTFMCNEQPFLVVPVDRLPFFDFPKDPLLITALPYSQFTMHSDAPVDLVLTTREGILNKDLENLLFRGDIRLPDWGATVREGFISVDGRPLDIDEPLRSEGL